MKRVLLFILTIGWLGSAYANNEATVVFQVSATFYQHPTRLFHPRINYWHDRGKGAEKAGLAAFQSKHYVTSTCEGDANGQVLIVIVPDMFYNQQMGIFHSKVITKVYKLPAGNEAIEKPLLTVTGEGQSRGWVSYNSENFTHISYQQAFDRVIKHLQENTAFQKALESPMQSYKSLCERFNTLTPQQLNF